MCPTDENYILANNWSIIDITNTKSKKIQWLIFKSPVQNHVYINALSKSVQRHWLFVTIKAPNNSDPILNQHQSHFW